MNSTTGHCEIFEHKAGESCPADKVSVDKEICIDNCG